MIGRALLFASAFSAAGALAAETPPRVEEIVVIGVAPLGGSGVSLDRLPAAAQSLSAHDLNRGGLANVLGALGDQLAGVNINDNLDDAFQPDILLRGFEASPVLGTPQGVAVYQNGVRINEAFGDTVNWDVIPDVAIRGLDVMGANPVFGLNALGGAVVVRMKTGFSDPGADLAVSGGSFGRREIVAEAGGRSGALGLYLAARGLDSDGWRRFSPDRLRQLYGDVTWAGDAVTMDLSVTAGDNALHGQSSAPVQELAVDRSLVFTSPQETDDRLAFVTLGATWTISPTVSVAGVLYDRALAQDIVNGNTTSAVACDPGPDADRLCQANGATPLIGQGGAAIPDLSLGGAVPIGQIDRARIRSNGLGGSLQITVTAPLAGRDNQLVAGASLDTAVTHYGSTAEIGVIDPALRVLTSGLFVATPEGGAFTATPVRLRAASTDFGLYATDTLNLTRRLAVTASGRFNIARIVLADGMGANLNGDAVYRRFNPALGFAYRVSSALTVYGGYSEGSRAPNASEIECSNPLIPCLLPSSLASDPPTLRQVVSQTWEAGLRGRSPLAGGKVSWNAGVFRTDVRDDIYAVATSLSAGYFQNIPGTRRQGVEASARYVGRRFSAFVSYADLEATFRSAFSLPSPAHPFQDAAGAIAVRPGDSLPGLPRHRLKLGADVELRPGWTAGASLAWVGSQIYHGDESNQLAPLPAYAVLGLHSTLAVTPHLSMFVTIDNALDAHFATYGVLGDPTGVGALGVPTGGQAADPRFQSPAAPFSAFGGVRWRF